MPTQLPAAAEWSGSLTTKGAFKAAQNALRSYLAGLLGSTGDAHDALISLGSIFGAGSIGVTAAAAVTTATRGKLLVCNGTFSISIDAAATLKDGFVWGVSNIGSGNVTLDPSLTEQIDGATTLVVKPGESAVIFCDGVQHFSVCSSRGAVKTVNGVVPDSAGDVAGVPNITAGSLSRFSVTGNPPYATNSKVCQFRVPRDGVLTVTLAISSSGAGSVIYGRIYKNGVAVGAQRSTSSTSTVSYNENFTVVAGDLIQGYGYSTVGSSGVMTIYAKTGDSIDTFL